MKDKWAVSEMDAHGDVRLGTQIVPCRWYGKWYEKKSTKLTQILSLIRIEQLQLCSGAMAQGII